MSIFEKFKNLSGPLAALSAQREEVERRETAGEDEPPRFQCRICNHQDRQGEYCPECLAMTMDPIEPRA